MAVFYLRFNAAFLICGFESCTRFGERAHETVAALVAALVDANSSVSPTQY